MRGPRRVGRPVTEHESSAFVRHLPCSACGSSDANALFDDGHTYCYSCGVHVRGEGTTASKATVVSARGLITGEVRALPSRHITEETCKKMGYTVGRHRGQTVQVATYYDRSGVPTAQKLRGASKKFVWLGDAKADLLPWGAQVWPRTGKMLVVTEGEIDALSMSQVQGNKYPVVSIGCGAGPQIRKYFGKNLEYFAGFESVVLMFDSDEAGQKAAQEAAAVLGARAKIATLPLKDPNAMLAAGRVKELIDAMWRAKEYRPEGILDMADLKDAVMARPKWGISWPWETLTKLTYGIRSGELYALGAGTGVGKTDCYTQIMQHLIEEHSLPIGVFALEQSPVDTATRLAGKLVGKPLHVPDAGHTEQDLATAWERLMGCGKVYLYDSFGANEWDTIQEKIEYLHHSHDVRHFFLDHLTALAAAETNEREALERIMAEMGSLVKRLDITVFFVSHLATPESGPSHEEGGRVTIRQFKGSRAIGFWSHFMFGLERDQQSSSPDVRGTTLFRVLKDRYSGRATGQVFHLGYDYDTGLLFEREAPGKAKALGFSDERDAASGTPGEDF